MFGPSRRLLAGSYFGDRQVFSVAAGLKTADWFFARPRRLPCLTEHGVYSAVMNISMTFKICLVYLSICRRRGGDWPAFDLGGDSRFQVDPPPRAAIWFFAIISRLFLRSFYKCSSYHAFLCMMTLRARIPKRDDQRQFGSVMEKMNGVQAVATPAIL